MREVIQTKAPKALTGLQYLVKIMESGESQVILEGESAQKWLEFLRTQDGIEKAVVQPLQVYTGYQEEKAKRQTETSEKIMVPARLREIGLQVQDLGRRMVAAADKGGNAQHIKPRAYRQGELTVAK